MATRVKCRNGQVSWRVMPHSDVWGVTTSLSRGDGVTTPYQVFHVALGWVQGDGKRGWTLLGDGMPQEPFRSRQAASEWLFDHLRVCDICDNHVRAGQYVTRTYGTPDAGEGELVACHRCNTQAEDAVLHEAYRVVGGLHAG